MTQYPQGSLLIFLKDPVQTTLSNKRNMEANILRLHAWKVRALSDETAHPTMYLSQLSVNTMAPTKIR